MDQQSPLRLYVPSRRETTFVELPMAGPLIANVKTVARSARRKRQPRNEMSRSSLAAAFRNAFSVSRHGNGTDLFSRTRAVRFEPIDKGVSRFGTAGESGRRCEPVTDPPLYPGTNAAFCHCEDSWEGAVSRAIRESEDRPCCRNCVSVVAARFTARPRGSGQNSP